MRCDFAPKLTLCAASFIVGLQLGTGRMAAATGDEVKK
jgi:hypothetical protein